MSRLILGAFASSLWACTAWAGVTGSDTDSLMQTLQSCLRPVIRAEVWTHEARPEEAVDIAVSTCLEEFMAAFESMPTPVEQAASDEQLTEFRNGMVVFAEQMTALGPHELNLFGGGGITRRPPTPPETSKLDNSRPIANATELETPTPVPATNGVKRNWQYTWWGMTPQDLQQVAGPSLEANNDRSQDAGDNIALFTQPYATGRFQFKATFLFEGGRNLKFVDLRFKQGTCTELRFELSSAYGPSNSSGSTASIESAKWWDETNGYAVAYTALSDTCWIRYMPYNKPGQAGGL